MSEIFIGGAKQQALAERMERLGVREAELIEKYWNNINFYSRIPHERAQKALDLIENLEKVERVGELIKLLVK